MEVPVGIAAGHIEVYQCPYCSKAYLPFDPQDGRKAEPPGSCRRCGSPMDLEKSKEFAVKQAEAAAQAGGARKRQTVKV